MTTTTHHVEAYRRYQTGRSGKSILTAYSVTCEECGPVGPLFVPTGEGMAKAAALATHHREESREEVTA